MNTMLNNEQLSNQYNNLSTVALINRVCEYDVQILELLGELADIERRRDIMQKLVIDRTSEN